MCLAGESLVSDTVRRLLLARAQSDLLRYQELLLAVTDCALFLLDPHARLPPPELPELPSMHLEGADGAPGAQGTRTTPPAATVHIKLLVPLELVSYWTAHKDNPRCAPFHAPFLFLFLHNRPT